MVADWGEFFFDIFICRLTTLGKIIFILRKDTKFKSCQAITELWDNLVDLGKYFLDSNCKIS